MSGDGDAATGGGGVCVNEDVGTYHLLLELLLVYICDFLLPLPHALLPPKLQKLNLDLKAERVRLSLPTAGRLVEL